MQSFLKKIWGRRVSYESRISEMGGERKLTISGGREDELFLARISGRQPVMHGDLFLNHGPHLWPR